jgi:hypothetical protein
MQSLPFPSFCSPFDSLYRSISVILGILVSGGIVAAWRWGWGPFSVPSGETGAQRARSTRSGPAPAAPGASQQVGTESVAWGPIHFTDVTAVSGVEFVHVSGDYGERPFPAANGSGVATVDFDLDGHLDLYFLTGGPFPIEHSPGRPANRCYRNLGEWRFQDVSGTTGLGNDGYSAGVAVGDFDADGFPDLFVNGVGPHRLYRNQGDGTFIDVGTAAGVADDRWGTSAAFLDYDNDGLLDLYVCHYARWSLDTNKYCGDRERGVRIFCNPTSVEPIPHLLLHNEGDGRFRDAAGEAGIAHARGRGQGVVAADFDGDGRIDLFVGNDLSGNFLFLNQGNGTFRDISQESGAASDYLGRYQASMGVDAADVNHDGRLDLFVTTFEGEHEALYENLGNSLFQEVGRPRGFGAESIPWVGWGTALADFDLDGWPDAVVTNGHTDSNLHEVGRDAPYAQPPGLWHNVRGRFVYVGGAAAGAYFAGGHVGRGLAAADLDNDGDLDLVIVHQDAPPVLLRNDRLPAAGTGWIRLRLIGTESNRDAVGAVLRLSSAHSEQTGVSSVMQAVKGGSSYLSAPDLLQIMALDENAVSPRLEVVWPATNKAEFLAVRAGGSYWLVEGRTGRIDENRGI